MRKVIIRISKDGSKTAVEVDGVAGGTCKDVTASLISRLGETTSEKLTDDYFKSEVEMVMEEY